MREFMWESKFSMFFSQFFLCHAHNTRNFTKVRSHYSVRIRREAEKLCCDNYTWRVSPQYHDKKIHAFSTLCRRPSVTFFSPIQARHARLPSDPGPITAYSSASIQYLWRWKGATKLGVVLLPTSGIFADLVTKILVSFLVQDDA